MLKAMEDQMNTKLFIRKTKGVILTNEGKELYRLIADNIDNAAHIGGLIGGILITLIITIAGRKNYTMEEWL